MDVPHSSVSWARCTRHRVSPTPCLDGLRSVSQQQWQSACHSERFGSHPLPPASGSTASQDGVVITIAHRLPTVLDADQIIVLENGHVRDAGTHHDFLASDTLYRGSSPHYASTRTPTSPPTGTWGCKTATLGIGDRQRSQVYALKEERTRPFAQLPHVQDFLPAMGVSVTVWMRPH